jgi:hypothetical protein
MRRVIDVAAFGAAPGRGVSAPVSPRFLIAAAVFAVTVSVAAHAEVVRNFEKALRYSGGKVSIEHKYGSVEVRTAGNQNVVVRATIRASDAEVARGIQILTRSATGGVTIRTDYPDSVEHWHGNLSFSVDYVITVPPKAPLVLRNRFGSVDVAGVAGGSDIINGHGSLKVRDVRGVQRIENAFGSIDAQNLGGDSTIRDTNGSVSVNNVDGALSVTDRFGSVTVTHVQRNLTISNGNGSVWVSQVGGSADITNSFASVSATDIKGDLKVDNGNGRVEARNITGMASLKTSFGSIEAQTIGRDLKAGAVNSRVTIRGVRGTADVRNTFGPVEISDVGGPTKISNENGNVTASQIQAALTVDDRFGLVKASQIRGAVDVENENGGVTLEDVTGAAKVRTSFAPVFLRSVGAAVDVENQNGSISVGNLRADKGCGDILLRTSFAPIKVGVPAGGGYRVSARTSFGSITSDLPITTSGVVSASALDGTIGNGQCRLELSNQNGSIRIERE